MKHRMCMAYAEVFEACRSGLAWNPATTEFAEEFAEDWLRNLGEKRLGSEDFWEVYWEGREYLSLDPFHAMHRAILETLDLGPGPDDLPGSPFTRLEGGAE